MQLSHLLILLLLNVFWAGSYTAYKVLSDQMEPGVVVTFRYALSALMLLPFWGRFRGASPAGSDWWKIAVMGIVVFCIGPRLQFLGVSLGKAGDASLLMALEPLITAVAAAIFLKEHIPTRRIAGSLLGVAGVAILARFWRADFQMTGLAANFIFIASFLCEVFYSIMGKPILERVGVLKVVTASLGFGSLANLLLNGAATWHAIPLVTPSQWWILLYLSLLLTVIGYSFWFVVIAKTPVNIAILTIFAQPVCGLAFAVLILHEPLHAGHLWGSLTIIAGLVLGLNARSDSKPPPVAA